MNFYTADLLHWWPWGHEIFLAMPLHKCVEQLVTSLWYIVSDKLSMVECGTADSGWSVHVLIEAEGKKLSAYKKSTDRK